MPGRKLDLLILGDIHYAGAAGPAAERRKCRFGLEIACRAVRDAVRSAPPDAIVVLGDIVDRGSAPAGLDDLRAVYETLAQFEIPIIAVPGNHDDYPDQVQRIFKCPQGLHELNGYLLATFADEYAAPTEAATRPAGQMERLEEAKAAGKPIIAVQHPAVVPEIPDDYPYNVLGARELANAYSRAGVCLSISGHFHAGLEPYELDGVTYLVCPAVCEAPFPYTRVRMDGRRVRSIDTPPLSLEDVPGLLDAHLHTEFAYCATDTNVRDALERLDLLGISRAGFVEHSDQLYIPEKEFWGRTDANDVRVIRQARVAGHSRHQAYRRNVFPIRSERIFLGLEAEPEGGGQGLAVLDEDKAGYDYLIGAVHHLGGKELARPAGDIEREFMLRTRQLVESGVDILAHPFRFFQRKRRSPAPQGLYTPMAELLASRGVAAEINFHTHTPDPEFFALCLKRGVKISLGSDAHSLIEVGELRPHLDLLRQIDAMGRLDEVLWRPRRLG